MTRLALRTLAVFTGYSSALYVSRFTHLIPGYGQSRGDDPIALVVWFVVSGALWMLSNRVDGKQALTVLPQSNHSVSEYLDPSERKSA